MRETALRSLHLQVCDGPGNHGSIPRGR
jgi:hypothetical protein